MGKALYRKYRSKSLNEVVGQEHITDILSRALKKGKIAHAYLFTGPRGVGKTSVARIMAHEINGLPYEENTQHPDIIEIDAASNRRIDDIRDLRDKVQIAPAIAKYKVYIIDEVHMLTGESFNAFLKTLEEPPAHVVFILATTDVHKLPATITSRTQRFAFRSIAPEAAQAHLRTIADAEKISIEDEALALVASHGDGSFRDSISLLDQLSSLSDEDTPITAQLVEQVLGMADGEYISTLLSAYLGSNQQTIIETLQKLERDGITATVAAGQLIRAVKQQLADSPKLLPLLEGLILVTTSPRPDIKLLVTLLESTQPQTKTVAAAAVTPAELQPLEKEASKPHPSEKSVRAAAAKEATAPKVADKKVETPPVETPEETPPSPPPAPRDPNRTLVDFDWEGYVSHLKEEHIALATILQKCRAESDGKTLTIYTGTEFWKKKLDTVKYQPILNDALKVRGAGDLVIETLPTTMPPKDSQAAAIAAIMGGGEEVEL